MSSKRLRKKRAKTRQRKGQLYTPKSPFRSMFTIKSVDIDANNPNDQKLLMVAQRNLYQIEHYLYNPIELEAVDHDTLKWLAGAEFTKMTSKIADMARYDPDYYSGKKGGHVFKIISFTISYYFNKQNIENPRYFIKAFKQGYSEMTEAFNRWYRNSANDKRKATNPFVVVYYKDLDVRQ